jgi:hypothetical protein
VAGAAAVVARAGAGAFDFTDRAGSDIKAGAVQLMSPVGIESIGGIANFAKATNRIA